MVAKILEPGSLLKNNSYRITELLGQGGFGAVYLADDLILEKNCAIKESFDNSPGAQAQFEVEARILANLNHPHLPRVTDNFIEHSSGLQYLVMEYVQGQDLGELLQKSGPLPEEEVRAWIDQVMDALAYLHAHRPRPIIHRDVKPDNIRLQPDGKTVKLVDFGIAKLGGAAEQTRKGARGATPGYSPPEQYGSGTAPYSDVYALGATLYQLLTNRMPPDSIDRAYSGAQLVPPRQVNPTISETMDQIILTAMQLEPSLRFHDAAEMRAALQNRRSTLILANCPHCGQTVRPEARFCASCGKPISIIEPVNLTGSYSANLQVQAQGQVHPTTASPPAISSPFPLDSSRPDVAVSDLFGLIRSCDQNWSSALGWLQSGRIADFLRLIGQDSLGQLADSAIQQSDPSAGLEKLLRAAGAPPPEHYRLNKSDVLHQLGFGLSFRPVRIPERISLIIKNTSRRGYLHGSVISLAPWLSLSLQSFGCLPGQSARLELQVDQAQRKKARRALRSALFEITFL
jgi:serine/threonine protein kinase